MKLDAWVARPEPAQAGVSARVHSDGRGEEGSQPPRPSPQALGAVRRRGGSGRATLLRPKVYAQVLQNRLVLVGGAMHLDHAQEQIDADDCPDCGECPIGCRCSPGEGG